MPDENKYEGLAERLRKDVERKVPLLAGRLRGGKNPPFSVKLSEREQYLALAMMTDENIRNMLATQKPAEIVEFTKHAAYLVAKYGRPEQDEGRQV